METITSARPVVVEKIPLLPHQAHPRVPQLIGVLGYSWG
jgi:hypothetical protein